MTVFNFAEWQRTHNARMGFTEEPDKTRRIEPLENPERVPQRGPERKREDFEPERKDGPERERKPERVPERDPVPA